MTTVLIPAIQKLPTDIQRIELFVRLESRFAWQARVTTLLVGASGFYLIHSMGVWSRYVNPAYWWVPLMTLVWVAFTTILFVLEPLFLHRWFITAAERDCERAFRLLHRMHWILLTLSVVAIVGAVAGSRGFLRP